MRVLRAKAHDYFGGRGCELKLSTTLGGGAAGWSLRRLWGAGLRGGMVVATAVACSFQTGCGRNLKGMEGEGCGGGGIDLEPEV
jgi:hypothetical protein